jgi:5'-3' exonuclease
VLAAYFGHDQVSNVYNLHKFSIDAKTSVGQDQIRNIVSEYMHIIQWNLDYYYRGTKNFRWVYQRYYAPLFCDIRDLSNILGGKQVIQVEDFGEGACFKPFTAHFGFLSKSSILIIMPKQYHKLVKKFRDFFKKTGKKFDLNGSTVAHKAVVLNVI